MALLRLKFIKKKSATDEKTFAFKLGTKVVRLTQRNREGCLVHDASVPYDARQEKHIECVGDLFDRLMATGKFEEVVTRRAPAKPVEVPGSSTIDATGADEEKKDYEADLREKYVAMKNAELREECEEWDLSTRGNKAELVERLVTNALADALAD